MLRFLCANTTKFCGKRLRENGCSWKKARKKSTLFKRCSVRRAATDTQVALPKGEPVAAQGQARPLYNLSVGLTPASSPSRGAFGKEVSSQRKGELAGLSATPEPPLLGEVALRSNDGEVVQSRALSGRCVASPFGRGGNAPALTERARPLPVSGFCRRVSTSSVCFADSFPSRGSLWPLPASHRCPLYTPCVL